MNQKYVPVIPKTYNLSHGYTFNPRFSRRNTSLTEMPRKGKFSLTEVEQINFCELSARGHRVVYETY
jgi:hypothetical protein